MQHIFHPTSEAILSQLPVARPRVVIEPTLAGKELELVSGVFPDWMMRIMVVSDTHTHAALGVRVEDALVERYALRRVLLQGVPEPTHHFVMDLLQQVDICDAIVAIGSGTINDLCKQVANLANKPYVVFPTAPSMNGYTSANASIVVEGYKQSFPAKLPLLVACDMRAIAACPLRLIQAGLGDSLARPTAQVDWLMSHLVKGTPYDPRPFELITPLEPLLFENAKALAHGDLEAVTTLMKVLLLSGFGMTLAGGSYPASQGEHMIAHTYESLSEITRVNMESAELPHLRAHPFHGEQIGVTTLTMARIQEQLMDTLPPDIVKKLRTVMLSSQYLESVLLAAGCYTAPEQLGWNSVLYKTAVETAHATRERYTFLNLRSDAEGQP